MAKSGRLNGVIRALDGGNPAFTSFSPPNVPSAISFATSPYDGIVFEMEHNPWDSLTLRDCLQYMLNRGQIIKSGSLAPAVAPMVRIPPNGATTLKSRAAAFLDKILKRHQAPHLPVEVITKYT